MIDFHDATRDGEIHTLRAIFKEGLDVSVEEDVLILKKRLKSVGWRTEPWIVVLIRGEKWIQCTSRSGTITRYMNLNTFVLLEEPPRGWVLAVANNVYTMERTIKNYRTHNEGLY